MLDKQHHASSTRVSLGLLLLLASSGCALIADLSKPSDDSVRLPDRGSPSPEDPSTTPQGGGSPTAETTCYADLKVDQHNCGFCSHDCGGARCTHGLCEPTTIVTTTNVKRLAVDSDSVFFATDQDVRSCAPGPQATCASVIDPKLVAFAVQGGQHSFGFPQGDSDGSSSGSGGTGGVTLMPPSPLAPRALALYGDRFFVADQTYQRIIACPKTGCSSSNLSLVDLGNGVIFAGGLTANASSIVWGETEGLGQAPSPAPGRVSASSSFIGDGTLGPAVRSVAWIERAGSGASDDLLFRGSNGVFTLPTTSKGPLNEILQGSNVRDVAYDGHQLAYVATPGTIVRVDHTTKAKTTLVTLEPGSETLGIIGDAKGIYVTVMNGSIVKLARVHDGGVDALAFTSGVTALALSTNWVYYATNTAIMRVSR